MRTQPTDGLKILLGFWLLALLGLYLLGDPGPGACKAGQIAAQPAIPPAAATMRC